MIVVVAIYGIIAYFWINAILDVFREMCRNFIMYFEYEPEFFDDVLSRTISEIMHTPPFEWTYTALYYTADFISGIREWHVGGVIWIVCVGYLVIDFLHAIITRRRLNW